MPGNTGEGTSKGGTGSSSGSSGRGRGLSRKEKAAAAGAAGTAGTGYAGKEHGDAVREGVPATEPALSVLVGVGWIEVVVVAVIIGIAVYAVLERREA